MKRIIFLCIVCVTLLCACFAVQEDANHISGVTGEAVSGDSTEAAGIASGAVVSSSVASVEEKTKPWIITDMNGKKRELKIRDVNTEDVGVDIEMHSLAEAYAQILDDHYYYLRKEGKRKYTLYRDKGKKEGSFELNQGYDFVGCTMYKNQFYVVLHGDECQYKDEEEFYPLASVDFSTGKLQKIGEIPNDNVCFYNDQIYRYMYYDENNIKHMDIMDTSGNRLKKIPYPNNEWDGLTGIIDRKLYYTIERGREIEFLRLDINSGKSEKIFHYEPNFQVSSKKVRGVWMDMDKWGIYLEERMLDDTILLYMVPRSGKKMLKISNEKVSGYAANSRYVFFMDTSSQIHRWNRKTQKEDQIIKTKIHKRSWLHCTEEGLYIQECAEGEHDLYFLDLDGKKPKKIWDDKNYLEEEWEEEDEDNEGDNDYW